MADAARRPLALGLALGGPQRAGDCANALARVERAEALGLHSVWLPEGHFAPGAMPSPLLALAAFAARTRRLILGTTSLLLPLRPPLQVAEEVATLDRLSCGRVWLGLGRGFRAPLFEAFGVRASEKRDRFDDALDTILAAWREAADAVRPVQRPHPPLLVAAFGRKGLLQAARRGLPYLASPLESLDALVENFAFHREHLPAGVAAADLPVAAIRAVHVARDDAEAARVRQALAAEARRAARALPAGLAGAGDEPAERRALVGTARAVAELLATYRERIGLELLIVRGGVPAASAAEVEASLERLAGEVLPSVA
jgi:alkanesulfonate monooxygenase SsuD/methylene tetrahydromethanopterin reductase-like flavin-dependent oxidoreductase (luciferase family)